MALETFLSTAEIDALFESSYLSYVSQMKSTVNLQNSTFEPASAKSISRKRKRDDLKDLKEQIKDEAYLFYALPDKRLSEETNGFIQRYNKDKSLLDKSPTIDDVDGIHNVIHKSGDLPCERYLAIACRKFENVVHKNDRKARKKNAQTNYRSAYVAGITKAGEEFVKDVMNIMFDYEGNIDLNHLENLKFESSVFDDEDDKNADKMNLPWMRDIEDFYDRMKQTEQGFLGLKKDNLRLYDEMKIQKLKKILQYF